MGKDELLLCADHQEALDWAGKGWDCVVIGHTDSIRGRQYAGLWATDRARHCTGYWRDIEVLAVCIRLGSRSSDGIQRVY